MSLPDGFFQLLVRCPRCDGRNAVDVRRQGLATRARCGRCGEALPRRLPVPLLLTAMTLLVVAAGLTHFAVGAIQERRSESRRARVQVLLEEGRAREAVDLLVSPRTRSSVDGQLARRVAEALAAPVLAAEADPSSGLTAVSAAFELGDRLVDELAEEKHPKLPELLPVLDGPLRRLLARQTAFQILDVAYQHATVEKPDLARVEKALQDGMVAAIDASPDVAAAVDQLSHGIRARATLSRAKALVASRPEEARRLLLATAQRLPPPRAGDGLRARNDGAEPPHGELLDLLARLRSAIEARDADALATLVSIRPAPSWPADARAQLDAEVRRACVALASLEASRAAGDWDPAQRAQRLLSAMTCDEVLPVDFVAAARAALAETLVEAARRGGSIDEALVAWEGIQSPRRDADLAVLACLAEARGAHATAVIAWSRVATGSALARLSRCDESASDAPPAPSIPSLDYPAPTG